MIERELIPVFVRQNDKQNSIQEEPSEAKEFVFILHHFVFSTTKTKSKEKRKRMKTCAARAMVA